MIGFSVLCIFIDIQNYMRKMNETDSTEGFLSSPNYIKQG